MKYVAVCVLSLAAMLSASASPPPTAQATQLFAPSLMAPVEAGSPGVTDSLLASLLAGALIAIQLRRRQKSLRSPRLARLAN